MPTGLQLQAKALVDATRYRLFRFIVDAGKPVSIGELTAHVQLNHNAVRQHLAVLKEAELVMKETEQRDRPGRPRLLYLQHPEVGERWDVPGSYAWLSGLLSAAIGAGKNRARPAARTGTGGPPRSQARAIPPT